MAFRQIRDITLGGLAAENDNSLEKYFFENSMFRRAAMGYTKILIGNRGSGKSAIFRVLAQKEKEEGSLVEEIVPNDYMYDLLSNSRQFDSNAVWARLGAYTASWKYVILVTAMKLLHYRHQKSKTHPEHIGKIRTFLKDNEIEHLSTPIDLLVGLLKKFSAVSRVSLDGIHFANAGDKTTQLDKFYRLDHLSGVIPAIDALSKETKILILFDELDHGWDASDDARQFIAGLFKAANQINQQFDGIHVLITIREEIYHNIPELYDDAQKIRDIIEHIRWTPEDLKALIAQRIKFALEGVFGKRIKASNPDILWEMIFEAAITEKEIPTYKYIVDRTLCRPRELIFFVNECLKIHNVEEKVSPATIRDVEKNYSKNRHEDIAAEFKFQYSGLREIFETFRMEDAQWERGQLEEHWLEIVEGIRRCPEAASWLNAESTPDKFIDALWKVGFLRAFMRVGKTPTEADEKFFVGYYQQPTLNIAMINHFDIHPMFRAHLGID